MDTSYCQDHLPVREQSEVVGHAVRAMYLYAGMVDVGAEWTDSVRRKEDLRAALIGHMPKFIETTLGAMVKVETHR